MDADYGRTTVGGYIQRPRFELYHIASDPFETTNLASDPAHAERLARYKQLLREMQEASGDRWVSKWDYE
jgi:N-sulfoglucosamine sulfohydrolase